MPAVDASGRAGFRDREAVAATLAVHYNTAPIDPDVEANEIAPLRQTLRNVFEPQNRALELRLEAVVDRAEFLRFREG